MASVDQRPMIGAKYRLVNMIGSGGMGQVYRGEDMHTGSPVAVKLLKVDRMAEAPDLIERFKREGDALRQLNHPNIVKMLEMLEEEDQHYLIMEYVSGGSLA